MGKLLTHGGGTGYKRDERTELHLRATTMFAGEAAFYEAGAEHDDRAISLARQFAVSDWNWLTGFLPWLRNDGNIRTMPLMLAAEAVHARLQATPLMACPCGRDDRQHCPSHKDEVTNRQLLQSVMRRPDEPGEVAQYWLNRWGRNFPMPVKRALAGAARVLYTQAGYLRYNGKGPMEFADILELTHPRPQNDVQDKLFHYILDVRHDRDVVPDPDLRGIKDRYELDRLDPAARHDLAAKALNGNLNGDEEGTLPILSAAAGQWEWLLSWLGPDPQNGKGLSKREQWELIIPTLGYMAEIRNLRNFDDAGLKDSLANKVAARIANPVEVGMSKQLPLRFLSAYKAAPSVRWQRALEAATHHSCQNIPKLDGETLILIDMSGSMGAPLSTGRPGFKGLQPNRPTRMEAGALFAVALALKNQGHVDVWGFADTQMRIDNITHGKNVLKTVKLITDQTGRIGMGTQIAGAVRATYKDHDRVIIFTDMQTMPAENSNLPNGYFGPVGVGDVAGSVPDDVHVYSFNLAGYEHTGMAQGANRHELGGLTDHMFGLIPQLEAGASKKWPWEM